MHFSTASQTRERAFVPPPPPRTPKSAGTRRLLLDLAAQLFVERGYNAVAMSDIAAAANLTKGGVYGHFRSKGQLLVEVLRWKIAERDRAADYAEARNTTANGVALMYAASGRDARLLEVDAAAAARHDPEVAAGLRHLFEDRHARVRDAMSELEDPDTAAWVVAALTAGIGMKESTGIPLPDPGRLNAVLTAAMYGIGAED